MLPRVKEEKTYLILTKFTKVKDFLICVKVSKRHTFWDGGSMWVIHSDCIDFRLHIVYFVTHNPTSKSLSIRRPENFYSAKE